jgi:hypothetical protein
MAIEQFALHNNLMLPGGVITLVSNVAAKRSAVWSVVGPPAPSVAALFTAKSRRPNRATVSSTILRTSSSWRASALMNSASEPKASGSLTSALPASSRRLLAAHVQTVEVGAQV